MTELPVGLIQLLPASDLGSGGHNRRAIQSIWPHFSGRHLEELQE